MPGKHHAAGYTAAIRARSGSSSACVEGAPGLGGIRLNIGCIPSKALLHASEMFKLARDKFAGLGKKSVLSSIWKR